MNDRKQQVIITAQKLFVEKGFSATSVQDIIESSEISKGTFYNYFSSKNGFLMAFLEHVNEEESIRRNELLIGQGPSDKKTFTDQILIRMQVHREYNLLQIFESIFHSDDIDLRDFIQNHYLSELVWLQGRINDVYGIGVEPYAADCAIMLHGMIQHMAHVWMAYTKEKMDTTKLVTFTVRRLDAIVSNMMHTQDTLIGEYLFMNSNSDHPLEKKRILAKLNSFYKEVENKERLDKNQFISFLMDEINSKEPRVFILESVIQSFRNAFIDTDYEREARKLALHVWEYVEALKK